MRPMGIIQLCAGRRRCGSGMGAWAPLPDQESIDERWQAVTPASWFAQNVWGEPFFCTLGEKHCILNRFP